MPFQIVRNDIAKMNVDAVVNAANSELLAGGGVCGALFDGAGRENLARACNAIGHCDTGDAVVTPGFALPARFIVHAVGPIWRGGSAGEADALRSCYERSLALALELRCESIAFPLISTGTFGYPKAEALAIVQSVVSAFLAEHDMDIYLVVFDRAAVRISRRLFDSVQEFIDDTYEEAEGHGRSRSLLACEWEALAEVADGQLPNQAGAGEDYLSLESMTSSDFLEDNACLPAAQEQRAFLPASPPQEQQRAVRLAPALPPQERKAVRSAPGLREQRASQPVSTKGSRWAARAASKAPSAKKTRSVESLEDAIGNLDESFSECLLRLIDERGMTDVEAYRRANVSRKLFSKIRSNANYHPSKPTVLAFAIALMLSLEETKSLLEKAGFALSHSSKFDVIVEYFIVRNVYDIFEINETLFAFDQVLLGS